MVDVVTTGLEDSNWRGVLYIMGWGTGPDFRPLYVGMARRWGRTPGRVSANLAGLDRNRSKFARWGDGNAYHIGDLSQALFGWEAYKSAGQKYDRWAEVLFEDRQIPRLRSATSLAIIPWYASSCSPDGSSDSLEVAEAKVIDLAIREFEDVVLNVAGETWWSPRAAEPRTRPAGARPTGPVELVTSRSGLERTTEALISAREVGLDVETTQYDQRLCLLQLSGPSGTFVIDANAVDVSPLGPLLRDAQITKVIHNAAFERRVLGALGLEVTPVVDTLQLSRALRGRRLSHRLDAVVDRELGMTMDKSAQTSRWEDRPLTAHQLNYAALDAEVLLPLLAALREANPQQGLDLA